MSVIKLSVICGIFIELASSTIGQRAKRVLGQCVKFRPNVPNLDNASGHKAIKETEKFNQSKAKTNDNCSKLSASDTHKSELEIGQWGNFVTASERKAIKAIFTMHQNLRHLTLFWILDYKNMSDVHNKQNTTLFFKFPTSICFEWLLVGT